MYPKIARHYEHSHKNETEVAKAFAFKTGSKERKKALEKLRLQGNYHHNLRVLESKRGQLIVMRRPPEDTECSPEDYLPCIHCLGFVRRQELWRHVKVCSFRTDQQEESGENKYQKLQAKSRMLILPSICSGGSALFQDVVASMKPDEITIVSRNDPTISALGTMMIEKVGTKRSHDVSQKMRSVSRLLLRLRETESKPVAQLSEYLCPSKFDVIVQCVKELCQFEEKNGEKVVGTPSLALKLGHALKKCIYIVRGKALRSKDKAVLEDVEHFEKLMDAEWNTSISHHSIATLDERKYNKPDLLPITSDLQKLRQFIVSRISSLTVSLRTQPSLQKWRELVELVLVRLILFNKRRGGETAKILLESYEHRPDWSTTTSEDVIESLTAIEQHLFKRYVKFPLS